MQWRSVWRSKASPVELLCQFLLQNSPTCKDKYVYLDQGGELWANPDVKNVFANWHYEILPTGTDSSHQNGPVERAHRSVGDHVRALLEGAALDIKFWPYAFFHHLCITNALAPAKQDSSRIFQATDKKENFANFRTFGCCV